MTTQNRHHKDHTKTGQIADTWQGANHATAGSYTDVDTLARGGARHAARPGSYVDTDILTRPKTDAAIRPGSYVDVDAPWAGSPASGVPAATPTRTSAVTRRLVMHSSPREEGTRMIWNC